MQWQDQGLNGVILIAGQGWIRDLDRLMSLSTSLGASTSTPLDHLVSIQRLGEVPVYSGQGQE